MDNLWKTIGHLFYANSSFVHYFVAIGELNGGKCPIRVKIGDFFCPVWPWNLTIDIEKYKKK